MFVIENHLGDIELDKKEVDGIRLYKLPNGDWVPSITSVTSFYNREIFLKWRQRVGEQELIELQKKRQQEEQISTRLHNHILKTKS